MLRPMHWNLCSSSGALRTQHCTRCCHHSYIAIAGNGCTLVICIAYVCLCVCLSVSVSVRCEARRSQAPSFPRLFRPLRQFLIVHIARIRAALRTTRRTFSSQGHCTGYHRCISPLAAPSLQSTRSTRSLPHAKRMHLHFSTQAMPRARTLAVCLPCLVAPAVWHSATCRTYPQ